MTLSENQLSSKQSTPKKRASKSTVAVVITKRKKKGEYSDPLYVDPPDDVFAPYFEEFQSKRAPNFTAVEDLILCKAYAAVSEDPTIGTDQTVETFWGKIFTSFIYLSATEADNGTFYKRSGKSMRDWFVRTIQPTMNVFNRYFRSVKNRKISGVGGNDEIYEIAKAEYEKAEGKPFPFLECAKCLHEMPRFDPMIEPETLVLADKTVISKGEASNMAAPMGSSLKRPVGMKAAKNIWTTI